jgi:hypothetical protein
VRTPHEENIEAVSIKDQKPFSDEQARFARKAQTKHQMKDKIAQKGTACPRTSQREHRNFEENSTPKGFDCCLMASPLGTPRGKYDEYSSKVFPSVNKPRFIVLGEERQTTEGDAC